MRQAGILAAAGLIALEKSPKRLHEDHANARRLANGLAAINGISIDPEAVVTNIVIFDIAETGKNQAEICNNLQEADILAFGWESVIRMVTHCDVSTADIDKALEIVNTQLS